MIKNLKFSKIIFLITGILALIAAVMGVTDPEMYDPVVSIRIIPGVFTQDIFVILAATVMIILSMMLKQDDYRKLIVIFGILSFFFYAYGIYAIEQVYTMLYPLYLSIFALSFYVLVYSMCSLKNSEVEKFEIPPVVRYGSAGYGIFIALMFNFIWISQLIPLLQTGERIEYTFSVYIIDLVFVMPAVVITGLLSIRKHIVGIIGLPALFVLGIGILSPLALAELLKPSRYGMPLVIGELRLYCILSMVFLIFSTLYLIALRPSKGNL